MKKLKTRIKGWLIVKIAKLRKDNKTLKNKLEELVLKEQKYIDKINLMKSELRKLRLENERLNNEKK